MIRRKVKSTGNRKNSLLFLVRRNSIQFGDLIISCALIIYLLSLIWSDNSLSSVDGKIHALILMSVALVSFMAFFGNKKIKIFRMNLILGSTLSLISMLSISLIVLFSIWDLSWSPVPPNWIFSYLILGVLYLVMSGFMSKDLDS